MVEKTDYKIRINTDKESKLITDLRERIGLEVIGQDRAVRHLLRSVAAYYGNLKDPRRPICGCIFAGPTGVGKTWMAKVSARHFLGGRDKYRDYMTRIDCSTLSQEHEVARLIGSPPGYIGYGEPPILSQRNIDSYHFDVKAGIDDGSSARKLRELDAAQHAFQYSFSAKGEATGHFGRLEHEYSDNKPYCSVVVFDEIEKAHFKIWNVLLQIMEEGELQLGKSGEKTIFSNSVIILTTNIGQRDIQAMFRGGIGFHKKPQKNIEDESLDQKIYEIVKEGIKKRFPPELFKRLDLVVFRPLKEEDFIKILDIFLLDEQEKLNEIVKRASRFIKIEYTSRAKRFLLEKGIDIHYGARTLRATVEKYIRTPISNGLSSGEIKFGDKILIDEKREELVFFRKSRPRGQNVIKPRTPFLLPEKLDN